MSTIQEKEIARRQLINLAKELDFESQHEYYDYIIDSMTNGQRQQARNLYRDLLKDDKERFLIYLSHFSRETEQEMTKTLLNV
jgi:hypothetical protein